jgi:hypothetical protein
MRRCGWSESWWGSDDAKAWCVGSGIELEVHSVWKPAGRKHFYTPITGRVLKKMADPLAVSWLRLSARERAWAHLVRSHGSVAWCLDGLSDGPKVHHPR